MSSLAHARLAPLTQRYLAKSGWPRCDVILQSYSPRTCAPASPDERRTLTLAAPVHSSQHETPMTQINRPLPTASRYDDIARAPLRETNTPRAPMGVNSNNYFTRSATPLVRQTSPSIISCEGLVSQRICCYSETDRDQYRYQPNKFSFSFLDHFRESFEPAPYSLLSLETTTTTTTYNSLASSHRLINTRRLTFKQRKKQAHPLAAALRWFEWHRDGHWRRGHQNNTDASSIFRPSIFAVFGPLGLFRKPTDDELEEEKARLSDEQKVNKMKPIELVIAKGVLAMCDQNYAKANDLFHDALHMAQDDNDEERENLILNLIASNYFEAGDFQNAEKLFIDLIKRMIARDLSPTAPAILELSLKLASIYSRSPETQEKALKGFKFVISSLLDSLDEIVSGLEELDITTLSDEKRDELALLGWSYDWFAKHLLIMNDYSGAASLLHKAYEISAKVLGPLHDQTLILLNDIGTTLAMNNSPDEGKTFIRKAVEGAIKNQSKELASFYVNLGLVNLKLRNLEDAKKFCEHSLDLANKSPDHHNSLEVIELSRNCLDRIRRLLENERQ